MNRKIISSLLICIVVTGIASAGSNLLTLAEAELLARAAAEPSGVTKLYGFSLEPVGEMEGFPNFLFFDAYVATPGAQGTSGHYAVNKFTGDVWNPFGCSRFSNPQLLKLQRELRRKLGLTPEEYEHHEKDDPCLV